MNGSIASIPYPINHGMLYLTGFDVIEAFLVHAPVRLSVDQRAAELARYRERIGLSTAPITTYPKLVQHNEHHVLTAPTQA